MTWSARQYTLFEDERTRPVRDLLHAVPATEARAVIDLGCGPGNSTEALASRFPGATAEGLDSSADMIAAARARLPQLRFTLGAIEAWEAPGRYDVVLANAVLHWAPDHPALLPRLARTLAPGGSLAVQMPDNLDEPSHRLMREVAADGPWSDQLADAAAAQTPRESMGGYYDMLRPWCARVDVWRTVYHHPLAGGPEAVVEWFKGSGLRPYLQPLAADGQAAFLARYRAAIAGAYPVRPDGAVLLPFPRLFIVATR